MLAPCRQVLVVNDVLRVLPGEIDLGASHISRDEFPLLLKQNEVTPLQQRRHGRGSRQGGKKQQGKADPKKAKSAKAAFGHSAILWSDVALSLREKLLCSR